MCLHDCVSQALTILRYDHALLMNKSRFSKPSPRGFTGANHDVCQKSTTGFLKCKTLSITPSPMRNSSRAQLFVLAQYVYLGGYLMRVWLLSGSVVPVCVCDTAGPDFTRGAVSLRGWRADGRLG